MQSTNILNGRRENWRLFSLDLICQRLTSLSEIETLQMMMQFVAGEPAMRLKNLLLPNRVGGSRAFGR